MKFHTRQKHMIDLIFPISLFFVFAASSLAVLLLAANIYGSSTNRIQANDQNRTSLSYISQKIRQNDTSGTISIKNVEGTDCLVLKAEYDHINYITYIYKYEGDLKELFFKEGIDVSLSSGRTIMKISALSMEQTDDHLFRFTSTNKDGKKDSLIISERSSQ